MACKPVFILLIVFFCCACCGRVPHNYQDESDYAVDFEENESPPSPNEVALMARYIVHESDWASVGTISATKSIKGFPFVGLKSLADGPVSNSTGIPYMMMTDMDISMNDLNNDNRCTLFMSLAEGSYCSDKQYDPQDPRCARVMLSGSVEKLQKGTPEDEFGRNALYTRHPAMQYWPIDHNFYLVRFNIKQVALIDFFGGIKYVKLDDYFNADGYHRGSEMSNSVEVVQIKK